MDVEKTGVVVEMAHFTSGGQNIVCCCSNKGKLFGVDLRCGERVWNLSNNVKYGKLSCA